jgi:uncharacterized protein YbjT (DUF2867 family)
MKKIVLIGAGGLVGGNVLNQALMRADVASVVTLTRRPLQLTEQQSPYAAKYNNVVVDFNHLPQNESWWQVDAVICTLGTTIGKAGSRPNFRRVDFDYPYRVAQIAKVHRVAAYALNSALGASADSRFFYSRTKGELENALIDLGFFSFTSVRPSLIAGDRQESRPLEKISLFFVKLFSPLIPARYRAVEAAAIAKSLLEYAFAAPAGVNIVESEQISR